MSRSYGVITFKYYLIVYLLLVSACLIYRKPPPHPLAEYALEAARRERLNVGWAEFYPMSCLRNFLVFKVYFRAVTTNPHFQTHDYIAISENKEPILLREVANLNKLLNIDNVNVNSDTTAWSIALLLFNINNRSRALSKKSIITTANIIPGHLKKLKKKNVKESLSLRERVEISGLNMAEHRFLTEMIEIHDKIYVDKILNINDSIHSPTVKSVDNFFNITFFTWEQAEGTVKKWQVRINQDDHITSYSYKTIAMYIGDWLSIGTMRLDYFNYEWGEYINTKDDE
jgi:hypothetical protein